MKKREQVPVPIKTGRIKEAVQRYSMGRNTIKKLAAEAGAIIRVSNKLTLYDIEKIDAYLEQLADKSTLEEY